MLLLLQGCRAKPKQIQSPETSTVQTIEKTIVKKDTVFQTKPDSAYYYAYIDCVNGVPVIKNQTKEKSSSGKLNITTKLDGNKLTITAKKEADSLFASWKQEYIKDYKTTEIKVPYPVEVEKSVPAALTFWQKLFITVGKIVCLGILIIAIIKIPWNRLRKLLPF